MTYRTRFDLACGLTLEQHIFGMDEMRWTYQRRFSWEDPEQPHQAHTINEWKLLVDFDRGRLKPRLVVSMHVIVPERLGKQYWLGVDLSPGAKTYLEFYYERPVPLVPRPGDDDPYWKGIPPENLPTIPGPFHLAEISRGARPPIDVRDLGPALVKPVEFPFPVLDRIPWQHGYPIPFLDEDSTIAHVTVPADLQQRLQDEDRFAPHRHLPLEPRPPV